MMTSAVAVPRVDERLDAAPPGLAEPLISCTATTAELVLARATRIKLSTRPLVSLPVPILFSLSVAVYPVLSTTSTFFRVDPLRPSICTFTMSYGDNSYGDQQYRGNYGASGPDFSDLAGHAERHHGSASSYFNEAANHLQQNHGNFSNQDIDEGHAVESHKKLYGGGGGGPADSNELGAGAAMEALKKFTGGSGGGGSQNQLIGLAMSEAEKLFDQHSANGNAVSLDIPSKLLKTRS
jgi:hypothetical protein